MQRTNRYITKHAIHKYGKNRNISRPDWIMSYQGMVTLAAGQVWWTAEVEEVFRKLRNGQRRAMIEYLTQQNRQIDDLVVKGKAKQGWKVKRQLAISVDSACRQPYRTDILFPCIN